MKREYDLIKQILARSATTRRRYQSPSCRRSRAAGIHAEYSQRGRARQPLFQFRVPQQQFDSKAAKYSQHRQVPEVAKCRSTSTSPTSSCRTPQTCGPVLMSAYQWRKDHDFGQTINSWGADLPKYGLRLEAGRGRVLRVPIGRLINTQNAESLKKASRAAAMSSGAPHEMGVPRLEPVRS